MDFALPALDDEALARALAALAAAGLAPGWPSGADRAALAASSGWSGPHLDEAVRRAFAPYPLPACRRLVALGRFAPRRDFVRNRHLLAILAGRVPALATAALFQGLAARHVVTLKPSSAEPVFTRLICALLARAVPVLAAAARCLDADSADPRVATALTNADAVLVYGSDATVGKVQAARPGRLTIAGGHRESAVVVLGDALGSPRAATRLAQAIARDVAIYDQSGCLSPQVVLVEDGATVSPAALADLIYQALVASESYLPSGPVPLLDAAAIRLFVEESRLIARTSSGRVVPAFGPVPPTVVLLPGTAARPAPGYRTLQVVPFRGAPDLPALLPTLADRMQGIAVAGDRCRLAEVLARHPAFRPNRICAPGRLQLPPAGWPENGIVVVRALARCSSGRRSE